jgi:hypothetical protein
MALPMPRPAPVISATRFSNCIVAPLQDVASLLPNAPGELRPTAKELRSGKKRTLWAVSSTGLFGAADRTGQLPRLS